jgi:hypothetical protein
VNVTFLTVPVEFVFLCFIIDIPGTTGVSSPRSAVGRHGPLGRRWILGAGLRVGVPGTPPFGARGRSSVRYGTRLGDLIENWFLLFSN